MNSKSRYSELIKSEAKRLGFLSCGISKAQFLEEEAPRLEKWLKNNNNGTMQYMENHFDKRLDPTKLVEGSKSVVRSEEHTSELQSRPHLVCRLLLEKKKK